MSEKMPIYETRYTEIEGKFKGIRESVMTDEQIKRADYYRTKYDTLKSDMDERIIMWDDIQELYAGRFGDTDSQSQVNIILPQIEGQVASMINHKITCSFMGNGVSDQKFAHTLGPIGKLILKENKIKKKIKKVARRYLKFGTGAIVCYWDDTKLSNFGIPIMDARSIADVLVDGKIKDVLDLQKAEYIILPTYKSYQWIENNYKGDKDVEEIIAAIQFGTREMKFQSRYKIDDDDTFVLLTIFTKQNKQGNLQLIQMSENGIYISESDSSSPYYKYVNNNYPVFMTGLYDDTEDEFYKIGDGQVLLPIQKLINRIYDEIILAVKFASQGRTYVDPSSGINVDEFAEQDPSKPTIVKNPVQFIKTERGQGINAVVFQLLEQLFMKIQEITRFSALMTGNSPGERMTATQAGIQMQQGITGIDDKREDISDVFQDALKYCIQLTMEFWTAAKAFRVSEDVDEFEWVDTRALSRIPEMIPASREYKEEAIKKGKKPSKWMNLMNGDEVATKQIEFDISLTIGEGMPTNKIALYNIVLSLSQLQLINEQGQPQSILGFEQVRKLVEETVGIKIDETGTPMPPGMPPGMPEGMPPGAGPKSVPGNANIPTPDERMKGGV